MTNVELLRSIAHLLERVSAGTEPETTAWDAGEVLRELYRQYPWLSDDARPAPQPGDLRRADSPIERWETFDGVAWRESPPPAGVEAVRIRPGIVEVAGERVEPVDATTMLGPGEHQVGGVRVHAASPVSYEYDQEWGTYRVMFDGTEIAGIESESGGEDGDAVVVSYGVGLAHNRRFAATDLAKAWIEDNAGDLADLDVADRL